MPGLAKTVPGDDFEPVIVAGNCVRWNRPEVTLRIATQPAISACKRVDFRPVFSKLDLDGS